VERAERLKAIVAALKAAGLLEKMKPIEFAPAGVAEIAAVHERAYVDLVRVACEEGMTFLGSMDTHICPASYEVARLAAGGVLAACDAVMAGKVKRAFCAVRPPGHHAEKDQAKGFCLFNNIAIAAEHLVRKHKLSRVAVVDFDVHHGNGTQHTFEERDDVLYISLHEHPAFLYPGTGYAEEIGRGKGEGFTVNIPMQPGEGDREYRGAFAEKVEPSLMEFRPEFLLISAGFDAVRADPIAHMQLEPASFGWMTEALVQVADKCCGGKLVSTLEGGYDLAALGKAVVEHVGAMGVLESGPPHG
jgi:acetoin utilization deacetylase AcuC-like enzyme